MNFFGGFFMAIIRLKTNLHLYYKDFEAYFSQIQIIILFLLRHITNLVIPSFFV